MVLNADKRKTGNASKISKNRIASQGEKMPGRGGEGGKRQRGLSGESREDGARRGGGRRD